MQSAVPLLPNFTGLFPNLPQCFCHYKKNILLAHVLLRIFLNQTEILLVEKMALLEKYFCSVWKKIRKSLQNSLDRFWKMQKVAQRGLQICKYETSKELGKMYIVSTISNFYGFYLYMLYATTFQIQLRISQAEYKYKIPNLKVK